MNNAELLPILTTDPWFGSVAPEHQALLLAHARLRRFSEDGALYRVGDLSKALYCVVEGEIHFVNFPEIGRQLLNYVVGPGGWFGELGLIDGEPRPHDAVFIAPCAALIISAEEFDALTREAPLIYRDIARLTYLHLRTALVHMAGALMLPPERRLARWLEHFAVEVAPGANGKRISQEDLAGAVGVSRQTASKILKKLESAGVLRVRYGAIEILDERALAVAAWQE